MPDLFIYNASSKYLDTTSSMQELQLQSGVRIPPGSQAYVAVPDAPTYNSVVAQLEKYGAVDHATVQNPTTFVGVSHHVVPVANTAKPVPIIVAPVVKPAKGK